MARKRIIPKRRITRWVTENYAVLREQLATFERSVFEGMSGVANDGIEVGAGIRSVVSRGDGDDGSSTTAAAVDHEHPLPFYTIVTYADLQRIVPAVGGVHTLTEGMWLFLGSVGNDTDPLSANYNPGNVLLVPDGVFVQLVAGRTYAGFYTDNDSSPALTLNRAGAYMQPFNVGNSGTGGGLRTPGNFSLFLGWLVTGGTTIGGGQCRWIGGDLGNVDFEGGQELRIQNAWVGTVTCASSNGRDCWGINLTDCLQRSGHSGAMVVVPDGQTMPYGVTMVQCTTAGTNQLLTAGEDINFDATIGAQTPQVSIFGCRGQGVTLDASAIPAGGVTIEGCNFSGASPFTGFDRFTDGVKVRACRNSSGALLESPNGHQIYNSAGTIIAQMQKLRFMNGSVSNSGDETRFTAPTVGTGSSNEVLTMNSGGSAVDWRLLVNANISATAEIAVSKLGNGSAYEVVQTAADGTSVVWGKITTNNITPGAADTTLQSTGSATEWDFLYDANIHADAQIDVGKLESASNYTVLGNNGGGGGNAFSNAPRVNTIQLNSHAILSQQSTPSTPTAGDLIVFHSSSGQNGLATLDEHDSVVELTGLPIGLSDTRFHRVRRTFEVTIGESVGQTTLIGFNYASQFGHTLSGYTGPKGIIGVMRVLMLHAGTGHTGQTVHFSVGWTDSTQDPPTIVNDKHSLHNGPNPALLTGVYHIGSGTTAVTVQNSAFNTRIMVDFDATIYYGEAPT